MYKPKYLCDLHTHTNQSDGNDTYMELIDKAAEIGMKVIAITDHDVTPAKTVNVNGSDVDAVQYAKSKGLLLIPGIEFSCDTNVDDVHVVGLGCDFSNIAFVEAARQMEQSKINGYKQLTEILCENNIKVSWDELLNSGSNVKKESDIQRKHIFEMIAQKGYTGNWQEAKLMIKNNPQFNVRREKIDPLEAIRIIQGTGGIAILAHPYLINEAVSIDNQKVSRIEYIDRLINIGKLDGIEACYTYSKTSYEGNMTEDEIENQIKELYKNRLKIISGGSDYHNDGKKGTLNPRMIGEKGITFEYFTGNELLSSLI